MSEAKRQEDVLKEVLFQLYAIRNGAGRATIQNIRREAFKQMLDFTAEEIRTALRLLMDDQCVADEPVPGSTEKLYRITMNGVRTYQERYAP